MSLRQPSRVIVVGMVAVYAYLCFTAVMEVPFPNTFDELGHFSYVLHVAESAGWWIDFDDFYMFDVIDYSGFTDEPNYINHPPAYYMLMSALSGASSGSAQQDIVTLRSINAALSTLGVVVAFALARRMQWEANVFYAFGIILILAPPLPIIGVADHWGGREQRQPGAAGRVVMRSRRLPAPSRRSRRRRWGAFHAGTRPRRCRQVDLRGSLRPL